MTMYFREKKSTSLNNSYFIVIVASVIVYGAAGVGFAFMAQNLGGTVLQVRTLVIRAWLFKTNDVVS